MPNYKDGSILNLMSSIGGALGWKSKYGQLKNFPSSELKGSKNIVLIVFDGLGYEFLQKYGKGTVLKGNLKGKITSIFPSVTSNANTSFFLGVPAADHGITGWHTYIKELGMIVIGLPYVSRAGWISMGDVLDIKKVFNFEPFANKIKSNPYVIIDKNLVNSDFSQAAFGKAKRIGCKSIPDHFNKIKKIIKSNNKKKYIHTYWPKHDSLCHEHGTKSKKVLRHFKEFDKELGKFLKSIKGTNTTVILTADHGMIDVAKNRIVDLKNHPKLRDTLLMSLCGDFRHAYCYVKKGHEKEFERYVKTKLKHACELHKSIDLVKKGYFGPFKPCKQFFERIGDYTIIMKKNYGIYDRLEGQKQKTSDYNIGDHGGLSQEEMYVPLVVVKT